MTRAAVPNSLYHKPVPYGLDDSSSRPASVERFVTTSKRDYTERDVSQAHRGIVHAADFQGRPLPYGLTADVDSLDRFITTNTAQFVPRDLREAIPVRREAVDFKGRLVPYAFDIGHDSPDRYETTNKSQFHPELFDRSQARLPVSPQANYFGRPLPYALEPGSDSPDKWLSVSKRHFVPRDLREARPAARVTHDADYNVVTFEPIRTVERQTVETRGRTAALGIARPVGVSTVPASRQTERHFVQFADNFHPNPLTAHEYASAERLREDMSRCSVAQSPAAKYRQPVTEAHRIGWQWQQGHDGFADSTQSLAPADASASPPAKEVYHGRKASYITKRQEILKRTSTER